MSDSNKSKKELIAELEALRSKMRGAKAEQPGTGEAKSTGMTRRDVLAAAWVAPVILTVPLGAAVVPSRAQAQVTTPPSVPMPTAMPTTPQPTGAPTTPAPTRVPQSPAVPTSPPQPPTAFPTAFPTAAPEAIPVELSDFDIR